MLADKANFDLVEKACMSIPLPPPNRPQHKKAIVKKPQHLTKSPQKSPPSNTKK